VLTEAVILRDKELAFSWGPVPGASGYTFTLYQNEVGTRREILKRTALRSPSFTLTDLTLLDAGEFTWQAAAERAGQAGETAENSFLVDLGQVEASEGRESGLLFGRTQ
jgi:hypothetical protein